MYGSKSATPAAALSKFEIRGDRVFVNGKDAELNAYGVALFRELFRNPGAIRNSLACSIAIWPKLQKPDTAGLNEVLIHLRRHCDVPGKGSHFGVEGNRGAYFDALGRADPKRKFQFHSGPRRRPAEE